MSFHPLPQGEVASLGETEGFFPEWSLCYTPCMTYRKELWFWLIAGLPIAGCGPRHAPLRSPPTTVTLVPSSQLRAVVPPLKKGFAQTLFLQRPGQVTYHIRRGGQLVAMLSISDLAQSDPQTRAPFRQSTGRFGLWPMVPTAMGDGDALLVADRFRVEVDSLGPSVGPVERDRWLARVNLPRLAALASAR